MTVKTYPGCFLTEDGIGEVDVWENEDGNIVFQKVSHDPAVRHLELWVTLDTWEDPRISFEPL